MSGAVFDANGEGYDGAKVRLAGQVYDREGDLILVWGDAENAQKPLQVRGNTQGVSIDDYVLIGGTLQGAGSYETVLGGNEETLDVEADSVREVSEERAAKLANPTTSKKTLNLSKTRSGFTVTVKSVAWADKFTRVTIEVENEGKEPASLSVFDAAVKQGSKQYEQPLEQQDESASELEENIRPGVKKKGTLTFERFKPNREAELVLGFLPEDIDVSDKPFEFNLK